MQANLLVGQDIAGNVFRDLRQWITDKIDEDLRPKIASVQQNQLSQRVPELIAPGECIHLYRDGTAWQGVFLNCTFFDELDVTWHAVDDHLIPVRFLVG
jgi:hypothetical protein